MGQNFTAANLHIREGGGNQTPRMTGTIYHEFGLPNRRAVAFDIAGSAGQIDKAMVFYHLSLLGADDTWKMTTALGVGFAKGDPMISPKLMIGRGFSLRARPGWAEISLSSEANLSTGDIAAKLDLTLGLKVRPGVKSYVQLFAYAPIRGTAYVRFESSTAVRIFGQTWVDVGLSTGVTPVIDRQVKLGLWTSF